MTFRRPIQDRRGGGGLTNGQEQGGDRSRQHMRFKYTPNLNAERSDRFVHEQTAF
jgi:hypothetical protein